MLKRHQYDVNATDPSGNTGLDKSLNCRSAGCGVWIYL